MLYGAPGVVGLGFCTSVGGKRGSGGVSAETRQWDFLVKGKITRFLLF